MRLLVGVSVNKDDPHRASAEGPCSHLMDVETSPGAVEGTQDGPLPEQPRSPKCTSCQHFRKLVGRGGEEDKKENSWENGTKRVIWQTGLVALQGKALHSCVRVHEFLPRGHTELPLCLPSPGV